MRSSRPLSGISRLRYAARVASIGASRRTALITGVAGQDGVYLARHLLSLGYHVVGTLRPGSRWAPTTLGRAYAYLDGVTLVDLDQRDHEGWAAVLEGLRPRGVRYAAAGSMLTQALAHRVLLRMEAGGESPDDLVRLTREVADAIPGCRFTVTLP